MITREFEISLRRAVYEKSYYEFFKWAFTILFPSEKYEDSPHIKVLCDMYQEEVLRLVRRERKDKDLIVNIPPRTSKTLITHTILLPWAWIVDPTITMIAISFDEELILLNAQYSKDILQHPLYQEMFGHKFKLRREFDSKGMFMNDKGGFKMSKTTGGNITGHKGCFVIGSKVLYSDNTQKGIEEVREGDLLETYNEVTHQVESKPVVATSVKKYTGKLYTIKTFGGKVLRCTENHPIFTDRGWVKASELTTKDILLSV